MDANEGGSSSQPAASTQVPGQGSLDRYERRTNRRVTFQTGDSAPEGDSRMVEDHFNAETQSFLEPADVGPAQRKRSRSRMYNTLPENSPDDEHPAELTQEPDTCRICSFPAEKDQPLYHPCKCSGTIRHVHQDCLKSWLTASRRTRCDLCGYTYMYKKVYSPDMPSTLPASILVKPLLGQLANSFLFFLRLVLVATLWLAIIPALLYWSWQLGFMLGDYVSLRLSGHLDYIEMYVGSTVNASQTPIISMPSTSFSSSLLDAQLRPTSPVLTLQTTPAAIPPHESFISSTFLLRDTIPLSIHPVGSTLSHPGPSILAPPASQHPPMNSKPQNPWYMGPPDAEAKTLYRLLHDKVADLFAKDHPYPLLSIIFGSVQILSYLLYWLGWWLIMSGISLLLLPYDLYKFNVSRCTSERILAHSFLDRVTKELSGPIVSGQFIAIIMVATYICLWFLREWIVENADDERLRRRQPGNNQPAANPQGEQDPPPDLEEFFDDLVEPPTPPLNIISLDDQAELMKEVQKRRAERAEQERKSRDIIKEWQVEKTSEIVAGWKEQKLKEIQHRLGDNATPLIDRNGEMLVADPRENTPQEILWAPLASDSPAVEQVEYIENTELAQATAVMSSKVYTPRLPLPTALPVESAVSSQQITMTASSNLSISMQQDGSPKADPHSTHKEISEVPPSSAEPEKIDKEPAGEIALKFTEILPAVSPSEPALPPVQHLPSQVPPAIPISELSEPKRSFTPPLPSPSVFRALVPPPNATDALPDGTIPPISLDPRPSSSASSTSSPWDAETSKFFPNKRPRRPSSSASSMDLRTNFRKPPFPPAKQGTPASTSPSTPTSEGARSTTTFSFTFPASQNMPKADKVFMKKPVATSGLNVNAPAFQPRIMAPVAHPFNVNAPTFIPTAASSTQVPGSQPSIGDPFLQGLSQVPQWAHGPHLAGAYDNRLSMVPSSGLTAFQSESSSTMPPRPDSVLPHLAYAMKNPVSGESSGSTPAQAARMTHGHSMSMGMGHRTKAIEETPRPRGRALTTGAGVSHSSISKSQSVSRLSTTNLQTSPPRSSSLSAQTPRRLGEANPLLQPRAPESASPKSAPNAQTMPWYGLPDPRPGLDRDLEMELKIKADYKAWREKVKPIDEARERKLKAFLEKYEADKAAAEAAEKAKADGVKPDVAVNNQGATEGNNDGPRIMAETGVSKDQDNSCPEVKVPQTSGEHVTSPVPEPKAPEEQSPLQISTSKVLPEPPAISQTSSNRSRSPGPIPSSKASIVEDSSVTPLERPSGSGPIKSAPNTRRDADRDMEMERKIKADYQAWREKVKPIDEARERRLKAFWEKYEADKAATEAAEKAKIDGVKLNATVKDQGATKSNNGPGAIAENEASKDQDNCHPEVMGSRASDEHGTSPLPEHKAPEEQPPVHSSASKTLVRPPATVSQTSSNRSRPPGPISLPRASDIGDSSGAPRKRPTLPSAVSPDVLDSPSRMALYQAPEEVKTGDRVINSRFNEELSHSDHYFNDHQEPDPVLDEEGRHINIPAALDAAHRVDDQEGNQAIVEAARRAPEPDIVDDPALPNAAPPDVPAEVNADEWDELAQMMRAVGMAGPWRGIAQNASLVLLVFNLTLGLAVFLPYVLGKTISLLLVEPLDLAHASGQDAYFHLPIRWITRGRGVGILELIFVAIDFIKSLLRGVDKIAAMVMGASMTSSSDVPPAVEPSEISRLWSIIRPTTVLRSIVQLTARAFMRRRNDVCAAPVVWSHSWFNMVSVFDQLLCSKWTTSERDHEDASIFHSLGISIIRSISTNRGSAIICGYLITIGMLALHSKTGGRRATQMPLTLVKVGALVILDAFVKPLVLGSTLDVFLFAPVATATPSSWINFWISATYANAFYHWLFGNLMMMLLQHILRDVERNLRPGALLKIQDYLDPRSPSIRSMIKNHILWHMASFVVGLMSMVLLLWVTVGLVVDLNNYVTPNFLPIRWSPRSPLSDVPIDLLTLHFFLPSAMQFLKVRKLIKKTAKSIVLQCSKSLGLEYVLFDHPFEDYNTVHGTFWRIPVSNQAVTLVGRPHAVETDVAGNGITQEDRDIIDMQILASEKAYRNPTKDFQVVFYPVEFKRRLAALILLVWLAYFAGVWTIVTLPICTGRLIFKAFGLSNVFDGYCWLAGASVFWFGNVARYVINREHRRWERFLTNHGGAFPVWFFLQHTATVCVRLAFSVILLVGIVPTLFGLLFEVYIVLPFSYHLYPNSTPTLRIFDAWSTGFFLCSIAIQCARFGEQPQLPPFVEAILTDGIFKLRVRKLARDAFVPIISLCVMILFPFFIQMLLPANKEAGEVVGQSVLKYIIPIAMLMLVSSGFTGALHTLWQAWVEKVRDQVYLQSQVIQNIEDSSEATT